MHDRFFTLSVLSEEKEDDFEEGNLLTSIARYRIMVRFVIV